MKDQNNEPQIKLKKPVLKTGAGTGAQELKDGFPPNAETVAGGFPAEPLNAISNLGFLLVLVYWALKTKFRIRLYPVIVITMPLMFCALVAGTMHHILRSDKVWHSITLLCIFFAVVNACVYLWYRVTESWMKSFLCVMAVPLVFRLFLASLTFPEKISVAVVFVVMALAMLIPAVVHCMRNHLKNLELLVISSLAFMIALIFREADANLVGIMPLGTHFLWHIFGAVSLFYLLKYLFITDKTKSKKVFLEFAAGFKSR